MQTKSKASVICPECYKHIDLVFIGRSGIADCEFCGYYGTFDIKKDIEKKFHKRKKGTNDKRGSTK